MLIVASASAAGAGRKLELPAGTLVGQAPP